MEAKINIAEILKDKPQGTKLWSSISNDECKLQEITEDGVVVDMDGNWRIWTFSVYGTTFSFPKGEVLLFPSKEMRNWSKFAWKKGDVLQHSEYPLTVIFESFEDDAYTSFKCKYCFDFESASKWLVSNSKCSTKHFYKVSDEEAKEFIKKVELNYNGKLNRETLEIEPAQSEFKDGDVVVVDEIPFDLYSKCIFILKENLNTGEIKARAYVLYNVNKDSIFFDTPVTKLIERNIHLATEDEKQQLFSALAKEGKAWDAEKKQIINLKPKWTPKPFGRVITRNAADDVWTANIFSHMDSHGEYVTIACVGGYTYCLPYNEDTAKLIGTTKDVEGD